LSESSHRSPSRSSSGLTVDWKEVTSVSIRTLAIVASAMLVLASLTGCGRTVLVTEGSPVRIGPKAKSKVYALVDGEWSLSNNEVCLPEGWYLVPPSFVQE
jgi:hypothetical protein